MIESAIPAFRNGAFVRFRGLREGENALDPPPLPLFPVYTNIPIAGFTNVRQAFSLIQIIYSILLV
jgi:hypothetical protein